MASDHHFSDIFSTEMEDSYYSEPGPPRRYHYLTRSQSALTYPPKPRAQQPQQVLYNQGYSSSLYHIAPSPLREEFDPREPESVGSGPERGNPFSIASSVHRSLSPIDEQPFYPPERQESRYLSPRVQGDNASVHSNLSVQSSLFINRPVNSARIRPSPSTSTFASFNSSSGLPRISPIAPITPSTPAEQHSPTSPQGHGGFNTMRKHARSFSMLPVIPASPRVSRAASAGELTTSPPVIPYPQSLTIPAFAYSSTSYRAPHNAGPMEEDIADAGRETHSRTPSLLARSESVRTELTYLTAPDSIRTSRPISGADGPDGSRLSTFTERGDTMYQGDATHRETNRSTGVSESTSKTLKWSPTSPTIAAKKLINALREHFPDFPTKFAMARGRIPESCEAHPAEVLFWMGFFGPWCWLIGGWMLTRDGEAVDETHVVSGRSYTGAGSTTMLPMWQNGGGQVTMPGPPPAKNKQGVWESVKESSLETVMAVRNTQSTSTAGQMGTRVATRTTTSNRLDSWVSRCRVAAVMSGASLLALTVVALVIILRGFLRK